MDPEYEMQEDPLIAKEREALRKLIVEKRAKFKYKTLDILKSIVCF